MTDDPFPMDEADLAFQQSLIPEDAIPLGFIAVALWIDQDGVRHWKCYTQAEAAISEQLGLLELAKLELVRRTTPEVFERD